MAKISKEKAEEVGEVGKSTTTEVPKKIDLQTFLDNLSLTRAERTYYERSHSKESQLETYDMWIKIVKIVH